MWPVASSIFPPAPSLIILMQFQSSYYLTCKCFPKTGVGKLSDSKLCGPVIFVVALQLCYCSRKAATDNA